MLKALTIENIAVAKNVSIELDSGFTVLTGKTGAGKTVIAESIGLLLGAKARRELVRSGENSATVTAIFSGEAEQGVFDENGEACMSRRITADGKSTAAINGKSVPISALKDCCASLLSMHSQTETASLYDKSRHILLLDRYAGIEDEAAQFGEIYRRLSDKKEEIEQLKASLSDRTMMVDVLRYQLSEIDKARITDPDEEEKLEKRRKKLKSIEQVTKNANLVRRALAPSEKGASAAYLIERAAASLRQLSDVMEGAEEMADRLESYRIEIIDIAEQAADLTESEDCADPDRQLDIIESRLAAFSRLKKKYGGDLASVMEYRQDAAKKLHALELGDEHIEELEGEYKKIFAEAKEASAKLNEKRREAAKRLGAEVMETLSFLDMPKVRFYVEVHAIGGNEPFNSRGADIVDFTVVTNPGEEPQSVSKIASGGEMSRIMLALKCAEAKKAGAECVVFDEIDTGVSGGTGERIGIKLSELAKGAQVICITHSAQVASCADHHILIEKREVDGRSESHVREICGGERAEELARIIGGINITEKQRKAALEMLEKNKK